MATTTEIIQQQLKAHPVIMYMKGTPELPRCGFSARAVEALKATGIAFASVDVLEEPLHPRAAAQALRVADLPAAVCVRRARGRL